MTLRSVVMVAGLALGFMSGTAKAAYLIDVRQIGGNVVATGSGRVNLTGLITHSNEIFFSESSGDTAYLSVGTGSMADFYYGLSGPDYFGNSQDTPTSMSSGLPFAIYGADIAIYVPVNYKSGDDLGLSTSVWDDQTIAGLGLIPGRYKYTWSSDSVTVNIGVVPLPAAAPLFGAAVLSLGAIGYGLKRKAAAAA